MTDHIFDECMARINRGDKNALHEIYEEYLPYIYSIVLQIVQIREAAEDITSEFFIKLWTTSESYRPGGGHKGYIATMARNMSIDYMRKNKKELLVDNFESTGDESDESDASISAEAISELSNKNMTPEDEVVSNISMEEALSMLSPPEREVINLKIMGDMTFQEIAGILNRPMGTVTWQYRNAINKLRRCGYE